MSLNKEIFMKENILKILKIIRDKNINKFKPSLIISKGETFPEIEKNLNVTSEEAKRILEEMFKEGFLLKEFLGNKLFCPKCGSFAFLIELKCPICGSNIIKKGVMIEHLKCGYIDFEEKFISRKGLFCPKCGKELKAIGVDYRKLETYYKCIRCDTPISPIDYYDCLNCFNTYKKEDLIIKEIHEYIVNSEKKSLIESLTIDLKPIIEYLNKNGLIAFQNINIKGKSGIEHNFSLVVYTKYDKEASPDIVLDVIIKDKIVDEKDALAFYAKAYDVNAKNKYCIAIPRFSENAKIFLKNLNVYAYENEDTKTLNDLVLRIIRPILLEFLKIKAE
ncbi:MAG: hypothetical protein QXY18_03965 [Nitrososphaerota archaeon]